MMELGSHTGDMHLGLFDPGRFNEITQVGEGGGGQERACHESQ